MKYNGAEITIKLLEQLGIDKIAGIPGGANLPLYDALYESSIKHILARHEQGAGFIAQGFSRVNGKASVCFATSGPGATNLITAIADAKLDSIPVIGITGQVPLSLIGTDAFQEVDTYGLATPITKHCYLVKSAEELFSVIPEAFQIAEEGRPGPVIIDIPKDVQKEIIEIDSWPEIGKSVVVKNEIDDEKIKLALEMIEEAKQPVILLGGGVINGNASELVLKFAEKNNIPVACTFLGLGVIPNDHKLNISMVGMHGSECCNYLMNKTDLLLGLGIRFDDRATGKVDEFCPDAKIIHVDIDPSEINKIKRVDLYMENDVKDVLEVLIEKVSANNREEWIKEVTQYKKDYALPLPDESNKLHPINIIRQIGEMVTDETVISTDVGQHQMWVAQYYPFSKPRTLLSSGGSGTMGFGLPTALGAALENGNERVICFSGDGSFLMNIQELDTLTQENLNVTIILLNNSSLGLVRQQQELFYHKNYIASHFPTKPNYAKIAENFGVRGYKVDNSEDLDAVLEKAINEDGPSLVDIIIDTNENVLPMVAPGGSNSCMIVE